MTIALTMGLIINMPSLLGGLMFPSWQGGARGGHWGNSAYAQLSVTALPKTVAGGYNIACNGGTDGEVSTIVTGNVGPYTYSWGTNTNLNLTGETGDELDNLPSGWYWVTVTDSAGHVASDTAILNQPHALHVTIDAHTFAGGTHISEHGAADGEMYSDVSGGIPPYQYDWNTGAHDEWTYKDVPAGEYSLMVTDAGGCTDNEDQTLTQPTAFSATVQLIEVSSGFHIVACADVDSGRAVAIPTGGIPPYVYKWSDSEDDSTANRLGPGQQKLTVGDANGVIREVNFEMVPTERLNVTVTTSDLYPNGYHTTCHDCANATITASVTGGTQPYAYLWWREQENGTATLQNAGEESYNLNVTDAFGCIYSENVKLRIPERDDWSVNGNSGLDINNNPKWLGTTDSTDLMMKANGQPMLRLGADGFTDFLSGVRMGAISEADSAFTSTARAMMVGADGTLKMGGPGGFPIKPVDDPCIRGIGPDGATLTVPTWVNGPGKIWTGDPCPANVGIGTDMPEHSLHVNGQSFTTTLRVGTHTGDAWATFKGGQSNTGKTLEVLDNQGLPALRVFNDGKAFVGAPLLTNGNIATLYFGDANHYIRSTHGKGLSLGTYDAEDAIVIEQTTGKVGIGVGWAHTFGEGQLEVKGAIRSQKVVTEVLNWPDFVSKSEYRLRPLQSVIEYFRANGHLPEIPPAKIIEERGLDHGELLRLAILKIEELTLYMGELERRLNKVVNQ